MTNLAQAARLEQVETHDSIFTLGYHLGYVRAMAHAEYDFVHRLPEAHLADVRSVLTGTGSPFHISVVDCCHGQYCRFVSIFVTFDGD